MDVTADDNFFIEEPQKLRNNFFNKDKSIQMVELMNQTHHDNNKRVQPNNRIQTCRLTYNKKLQQIQLQHLQQQHQPQLQQHTTATTNNNITSTTMPKSFITRLELLCQATYNTDDYSVAKRAVETLISASKSGCCFLERYIVMLLNFCTKNHPLSDDTMKIKIEELLNRVLIVDFDRQQLTENLRRPEYKLNSVNHIIQLLRRFKDMLDYRERVAINWLFVILDAYFVELATTDEAVDIIDQISAHINFQCALLRETENTKTLLKSTVEQLDNDINNSENNKRNLSSAAKATTKPKRVHNQSRYKTPHYSIEYIEF